MNPMKSLVLVVAVAVVFAFPAWLLAQPARPGQGAGTRVEAQKKDTAENWTLGDQAWDFKDVLTAYEPVKGYVESRGGRGQLVVWKLKLVKDFEEGAAKLHEELRGSPFKIVLLDSERTVIHSDLSAQITPLAGKLNDTIEMHVSLPDAPLLRDVKLFRVQRRTDVGF
jgi:hypothetical protein